METQAKIEFLKNQFTNLIGQIPSDTLPHFGKMTLQQMVEHFTDSVKIASGKTPVKATIGSPEQVEKLQEFLLSDKPFKENTYNPLLPAVPAPVRNRSLKSAIEELQQELDFFFNVFEKNHLEVSMNPIFGNLDFEKNVQLLYKHACHHLRQYGVHVS